MIPAKKAYKDLKLTKLEVKGFKSFGDKISIAFDDGVTAIVGPNGCGKSNVVDAIRWVLGEQSTRALRSEKMENVIFNGSQSRKAGNLAEVSLSFDNSKGVLASDFTELTLTRKLYRTGESEYRLNDVPCRLKDITDLFLDTGIGPDSYSIIELKMVEEIISNKEGSRRSLFEEASGISKYKVRKKQTFSKLKDTEEDLSRVDDLLFEIEKNLKTLESQARRTERYYKLKDQYRELSVQLAKVRVSGFKDAQTRLDKSIQEHSYEKTAAQTMLDSLTAKLEELKLESLHKEKNLILQQKTFNEFKSSVQEYENQKKLQQEQLKNLTERKSRLQQELENDHSKLAVTNADIHHLQQKKIPESRSLEQYNKTLPLLAAETEQAKHSLQSMRTHVESIQKKQYQHLEEIQKKEKEIDRLRIQVETFTTELNRNSADRETRENELRDMSSKLQSLDESLEDKSTELELLNKREETITEAISNLEGRLEELRDQIQKETRQLDSRQNEYKLTKSLVDNLEGFPDSIRFLKKNAPWLKTFPLLSDIIFCPENYRVTIENYLESYMNYYVVDKREDALKAVRLLSDSEKGRANFFILEALDALDEHDSENNKSPSIEHEDKNPDFEHENKSPGVEHADFVPAKDVLETDPRYQKLLDYLFKNAWIKLNGPSGVHDEVLETSTFSILDELGRYISSPFHVSGGSVGLFEGKRIGRAKNLDLLLSQVKEGENALSKYRQVQDDVQERLRMNRSEKGMLQIKPIREAINKLQSEESALKARKEQYEFFIHSNLERKEDIVSKLKEIELEISIKNPLLIDLEVDKAKFIEELTQAQTAFQNNYDKQTALSEKYNQHNIAFHQQQNIVSAIEKDLEYKMAHKESITGRIGSNQDQLLDATDELEKFMESRNTGDSDLGNLYSQLKDLEIASREIEEDYFDSKGKINSVEQEITEFRRKREQSEVLIQAVNEKLNALQLELHGMKERLSVEFNVSSDDLEETVLEIGELDEEGSRQRNEKIKQQLDTFGAINPLAMEAFREMDDRYQFIKTQKEDLLLAKRSLMETIKEIDDTAKNKFIESFTHIRDNFILVFRSLFNEEDSCDLVLTDPANPLDSDIEIIAKPKGKRPLTINQLSGGEKTLTATAILFSLYLLKPAPFCIFDEVDAPLDDTNIDKFNKIIRKFSESSQFIVVTHNKRTIASTDVIYGITMIEAGISRVVPVDLRNMETKSADSAA